MLVDSGDASLDDEAHADGLDLNDADPNEADRAAPARDDAGPDEPGAEKDMQSGVEPPADE